MGPADAGAADVVLARFKGRPSVAASKAASRKSDRAKADPGPVLAVVSIARQRISVYGKDGLIAHSGVSSGAKGHATPTGVFTVIQKSRYHRSNLYSDAPMPYMQRITWSGIALHAGVLPGYPASHGCIRLSYPFAAQLWGITRVGARVVVAPDDPVAVELTHPALPIPVMTPAPDGSETADGQVKAEFIPLSSTSDAAAVPPAPKMLNPMELARIARTQTRRDAIAKAKAAKEAVAASAARAAEASKAIAALRQAELAFAAAEAKAETAKTAMDGARTPEALEAAKAAYAAADAKVDEAHKAATEAAALEAAKTPEAFAAAKAAWAAEQASRAATAAQKAAELGVEPVSVFLSKKTGKIYVRQSQTPIYEGPVTFKDPDELVGTHLYVAMGQAEDGKGMRWLSVYTPPSPPTHRPTRKGKAKDDGQPEPTPKMPEWPKETASASVLDRIELPEEARQFIASRLWTGGAIIVSDMGISDETGSTTDFIVLTR